MSKGLRHAPLADIELIRQNLKDRYTDGFPILKELLQNAEDSHATRVEFAWLPGLEGAEHPLLRAPAIIAINDGAFTPSDREAIRQMGLSDKLRQGESIGKFGLGLKSVFHWCEAFFYIARADDASPAEGDILNPWSGEPGTRGFHGEWDAFSRDDAARVTERLAPVLGAPPWFCLWIPLRRRDDCGGVAPIQSYFPGDVPGTPSLLTDATLVRNLSETLPLLVSLASLRVWLPGAGEPLGVAASVELLRGAGRRAYRRNAPARSGATSFSGEIRLGDRSITRFRGQEVVADGRALRELKQSPLWPHATRVDQDSATVINVPEKAEPHGAAVFTVHPAAGLGTLAVTWAAFLPLGKPAVVVPCPGPNDHALLLHGDFFVDPGRNRPDLDDPGDATALHKESDLRRHWNRLLAEHAVIPRVLPALRDTCAGGLRHEEVMALTSALGEAFTSETTLASWRATLSGSHQWAYCLGQGAGSWHLLPAGEPLLGLPAPVKSDPGRPYAVFPALADLARQHRITFASWPRISASRELGSWPEDALLALLGFDAQATFESRTHLQYLVDALALAELAERTPRVQAHLVELGRDALRTVSYQTLGQHRQVVKDFLGYIIPDRLLPLRSGKVSNEEGLFRALLRLQVGVLPVPADLAPDAPPTDAELSVEDGVTLLRGLASAAEQVPERERVDLVARLATQVLDRCGERRRDVLDRCRDVPLFSGYDCYDGDTVILTWNRLEAAHADGCLFTYAAPPSPRALAEVLQEALRDHRVLLVPRETAQALFDGDVPPCTPAAAAQALLRGPALATGGRVRLLRELVAALHSQPTPELVGGARYLLHGTASRVADRSFLLLESGGATTAWSKLAEQALDRLGARWRLVGRALGAHVPAAQWSLLSLEAIDASSAEDLVREAGAASIACDELSPDERDQVIRDLGDLDLLRQLRIHLDRAGALRAIEARTYLEGEYRVDEQFAGLVTILCASASAAVLDRQRRLLDTWTPRTAIRVALAQPEPHRFAGQILDALRTLGGATGVADDLRASLCAARWLPGRGDTAFPPADVLHIDGLEEEIGPIAAASGGVFTDLSQLDPSIAEHAGLRHVIDLLPRESQVLVALADLIASEPQLERYRLGRVALSIENFEEFLVAFRGSPPSLLPALPLLEKAGHRLGATACVQYLVPGLARSIPAARLAGILRHLASQDRAVPPAQQGVLRRVHGLYLDALVRGAAHDSLQHVLSGLELLSARGHWRSIGELCDPSTAGIDTEWVVDQTQYAIVAPALPAASHDTAALLRQQRAPAGSEVTGPADQLLRQYFQPWEGHCSRAVLGGFLSLLGDGPVRTLAEDYFDQRGLVDTTRMRLRWRPVPGVARADAWGASDSPVKVIGTQRFQIALVDPSRSTGVPVQNLLGQTITAPPSETFDDLLVGSFLPHVPVNNPLEEVRTVSIALRVIRPERFSEGELSQLLRETARQLLRRVYVQPDAGLAEFWERLREGEQKDIRVAQNQLTEDLFGLVRQLGLHGHPSISSPLGRWDRARRQLVELEDLAGAEAIQRRTEAEAEKKAAREQLKQLLESDAEVQELFLGAVRERLEHHYQYRPASVPFEIFQNADDAVVELGEMYGDEALPAESAEFHMVVTPSELTFAHWGRPINTFRRGGFDGRARGFDADLEKMLRLAASDKARGEGRVTGRFGLGFKSVFLLASRAEVVSDRLAFEVVAGLFPRRLAPERRTELVREFAQLAAGRQGGTVIALPGPPRTPIEQAAERFTNLAPILLVFARAVKRCWVHTADGTSRLFSWEEAALGGSHGVGLGRMAPRGATEPGRRVVVLRLERGAILLALGPRGFQPLEPDVPTVWVTAPTTTMEGLGFAVNGPFDLDVGRAQLASDSEANRQLADALGTELGRVLQSLASRAELDWQGLVADFGLAAGAEPYDFWDALWSLFGAGLTRRGEESEARRLIRRVLWGHPESGMAALVDRRQVLPSGLSGPYRQLTRPDHVTWSTRGVLDERPEVFKGVSRWSSFQERTAPGSLVSRGVAATLRALAPTPPTVGPVTLADAVTWEAGANGLLDPGRASAVGSVLTRDMLDALRTGTTDEQEEYEALRTALGRLRFASKAGSSGAPASLLVSTDEADEADEPMRARFAPPDRVLSPAYRGTALALFKLCRGREQPGSQDLARWALAARDDETQLAVLQYLAQGKLSREMAGHLQGQLAGTWLGDLATSPLLERLAEQERLLVLVLLHQLPPLLAEFPPLVPVPPERRLEPAEVLARVHDWWQVERASRLGAYLHQIYPDGVAPRLHTEWDQVRKENAARREWLKLFLLGTTFTLRGVQREQHRAFVQWCDTRGWLDHFATPSPDGTGAMRLVREFLEQPSDTLTFYYWMRLFVPLFQLSTWLDEYVEVFLGLQRQDRPVPLNWVLTPNTNPTLSGSGIFAPPLGRTLGIGACFVMRELRRTGILQNAAHDAHCFAPTRSLRMFLLQLGCDDVAGDRPRAEMSGAIHRFLTEHLGAERARFGGCFDIPLLLVAESPTLQQQILHQTVCEPDGEDPDEVLP